MWMLKNNEEKTEACLFYKRDHPTIALTINNKIIRLKKTINVLGVLFDSKLQWTAQVSQTINKSKKALHGIKLVSKYLTKTETKPLLTSNFYSILYYNCEIWLMSSLAPILKQHLLSASASALKLLNNVSDLRVSYDQLHKAHKRAPPIQMMKFRLSIQLCKTYKVNDDWIDLNMQHSFALRRVIIQSKILNWWYFVDISLAGYTTHMHHIHRNFSGGWGSNFKMGKTLNIIKIA